jgi:3D (Asp-Asp-Asp) domain-containing protein
MKKSRSIRLIDIIAYIVMVLVLSFMVAYMPKAHAVEYSATGYCPCVKCCGKWALDRPDDIVHTASGEEAEAGVTIAVDSKVIPIGTKVAVNGHLYYAQDVGGGIKGNEIDIYFNTHNEAFHFGRQAVNLQIAEVITVEEVEPLKQDNILAEFNPSICMEAWGQTDVYNNHL